MQNEHVFEFNIGAEINRYCDDSSLPDGVESRIVIFMGSVAGGKTSIRKQLYLTGFVFVDAADRGDDCISAYYAEPFQRAWLRKAAGGAHQGKCP